MKNPFVNIGTTFHVSVLLPAEYNAVGYAALVYTKISGIRSTGEIGERYNTREDNTIGNIARNIRTGKAVNQLPLELIKIDDTGQNILKGAMAETAGSYAYRVNSPDGTIFYFAATASSRVANPGEKNSIGDLKMTLELDTAILEI